MTVEDRRAFTDGVSLGVLTRLFSRDLVDDVLRDTGKTGQRRRLLPGRLVVYYVLALVLFCADSYEEVMRKLVNGLRFLGGWGESWRVPSNSAISKARERLGVEPFAELFDRVAAPLASTGVPGAWLHGLRLMAVDGVVLDMPDTAANRDQYTKMPHAAGESPYPQVRMVGLGECGTHAIIAAHMEDCKVYERELLKGILGYFNSDMLVLADRGFYSYPLFAEAYATGAALLWRVSDSLNLPVLESLPDGSYRSELLSPRLKSDIARGKYRDTAQKTRIPIRFIEYMITNRKERTETIRLITTVMEHELFPAIELATAYAQRWEFELTLDEIETHQMATPTLLRSRTPTLVQQEIWALLLTHYAVRAFMLEAAENPTQSTQEPLDVDRISFIRSLNAIRRQVPNQAGFSPSTPPRSHPRNTR